MFITSGILLILAGSYFILGFGKENKRAMTLWVVSLFAVGGFWAINRAT